jgi:hypothetical protein
MTSAFFIFFVGLVYDGLFVLVIYVFALLKISLICALCFFLH